jgi:hypothetical protein
MKGGITVSYQPAPAGLSTITPAGAIYEIKILNLGLRKDK